jgi:peptidoglycan/xylan/chitin deacetylase (PgdA/CDA1 family)
MLKRLWSTRRTAAGALIQWSGAGRAYEAVRRPEGAVILMYHSVSGGSVDAYIDPVNRMSPDVFEREMAFLSEHRRVISLSALVAQTSRGESPRAGTVCITFDDGYLDNLAIAAPILAKYRLPATLFLATGYVQRRETQWADVLYSLKFRRTADRLSLPEMGLPVVDLASSVQDAAARRLLHRSLLEAEYEQRTQWLQEIERQLKPEGTEPRVTMNWDEARALFKCYPLFEIGGHTRDHIDLRTHTGDVARGQIDGCAADLRRELGLEPQHFSFPYGRWCGSTRALVKASGWHSAVGAGDDLRIGRESDLFAMPRIEAPRVMTDFRFKTSGAFPGALSLLGLK